MTTFAGKTTVGVLKFMFEVAENKQKFHVIAGLDLGTLEKNIITADYGIVDIFSQRVEYKPGGGNGAKLPHIRYRTPFGLKIIYTLGYADKARWKKVLGGQYGCVYIDEINVADMDFTREIAIRCDYLMATLNPDDPSLPVYEEFVNRSRPLPEWEHETPAELLGQLNAGAEQGWTHWYFSFKDNPVATPEKIAQITQSAPKGSKLYKNKVLGLRGRATGLVFNIEPQHLVTRAKAKECRFVRFSCGVDTSYSSKSPDTIAFIFVGYTDKREKIVLACKTYNNKDLQTPLAPSDIPVRLVAFLDACHKEWGFARDVYIDSADAGTITECNKYKRAHGSIYNFHPAYKKMHVMARIKLELGWLAHGVSLIMDECMDIRRELDAYSWKDDKDAPEDKNDHTINAWQYAWLPFIRMIGDGRGEMDG